MFKYIAPFIIASLLASCASTHSYDIPSAKQYSNQLATIKGYRQSNSFFDLREAYVTSIDDKDISYFTENLIGGNKGNKVVAVLPGSHTFAINGFFNREFMGNGPYEANLDVTSTLLPGKNYHVEMGVHGATISVWIADQHGKAVSSVVSNNYKTVARTNTVFIPVSSK